MTPPAPTSPTSKPTTHPAPKPRLQLLPGLPPKVANKLRHSKVVVVSLYQGSAIGDRSAVVAAAAGARGRTRRLPPRQRAERAERPRGADVRRRDDHTHRRGRDAARSHRHASSRALRRATDSSSPRPPSTRDEPQRRRGGRLALSGVLPPAPSSTRTRCGARTASSLASARWARRRFGARGDRGSPGQPPGGRGQHRKAVRVPRRGLRPPLRRRSAARARPLNCESSSRATPPPPPTTTTPVTRPGLLLAGSADSPAVVPPSTEGERMQLVTQAQSASALRSGLHAHRAPRRPRHHRHPARDRRPVLPRLQAARREPSEASSNVPRQCLLVEAFYADNNTYVGMSIAALKSIDQAVNLSAAPSNLSANTYRIQSDADGAGLGHQRRASLQGPEASIRRLSLARLLVRSRASSERARETAPFLISCLAPALLRRTAPPQQRGRALRSR